MALCFLQVLREPVVQYLAGSEQRIAPFWNIITWYPTSVPSQEVITKDNAMVRVDGVIFYQVLDAAKASYEVNDLVRAILNLTMTISVR